MGRERGHGAHGAREGPPLSPGWSVASFMARTADDLVALGGPRVDGAALLGERAALAGLTRRGAISPGDSCRLVRAADGWIAVNLARPDDVALANAWLDAITRSAILAGLRTVHDFDAGGMLPKTDVAGRTASPCIVIVQVQQGAWVQVDPAKKGTFDCTEPGALTAVSLDPIKAYKPG